MTQRLLFSTPHGSRLYGLHHANSDYDTFNVFGWDKGKAKQNISGDQDVTRTSLDRFLTGCNKGVPQFLEAMFSRQATVDEIEWLRTTYRPNMPNVRDTYHRTIKSFWMNGVEEDDFKRRRHAWRLWFNLEEMEESGRFNPTLGVTRAFQITSFATKGTLLVPPSLRE